MDCDQVQREEIAEKYVLGVLSPEDQEAYELHILECPRCREECQTHLALRAAMQAGAAEEKVGWLQRTPWWQWAAAAGVAGILVVAGVALWPRGAGAPSSSPGPAIAAPTPGAAPTQPPVAAPTAPTTGPVVSLAQLARVDPPPYTPIVLRGLESDAHREFRQAMKDYSAGDYATAASGLEKAAKLDPKAPETGFFLGASYLLTGRNEAAIADLRRTVGLGDTPFLEAARFYLAKAYLRTGDLDAARAELTGVVQVNGALAEDAKKLLSELDRNTGDSNR